MNNTQFTKRPPRLAFQVEGEGPGVLLIMGFMMKGAVWRAQFEALREQFKVVRFDARGLGASDDSSEPYSMSQMAQDAVVVAEAAGLDRFHVVGISMGGMVAQHLALAHPNRVLSLCLIATHSGGVTAPLPPIRSLPRVLAAALLSGNRKATMLSPILHPKSSLEDFSEEELERRRVDAFQAHVPPSVGRRQLRAVLAHNTKHRLHEITCPTVVVAPLQDRLCRVKHSKKLAQALPNATLIELENAGHGLVFHAASEVNQVITDHVNTVEAAISSRATSPGHGQVNSR